MIQLTVNKEALPSPEAIAFQMDGTELFQGLDDSETYEAIAAIARYFWERYRFDFHAGNMKGIERFILGRDCHLLIFRSPDGKFNVSVPGWQFLSGLTYGEIVAFYDASGNYGKLVCANPEIYAEGGFIRA